MQYPRDLGFDCYNPNPNIYNIYIYTHIYTYMYYAYIYIYIYIFIYMCIYKIYIYICIHIHTTRSYMRCLKKHPMAIPYSFGQHLLCQCLGFSMGRGLVPSFPPYTGQADEIGPYCRKNHQSTGAFGRFFKTPRILCASCKF